MLKPKHILDLMETETNGDKLAVLERKLNMVNADCQRVARLMADASMSLSILKRDNDTPQVMIDTLTTEVSGYIDAITEYETDSPAPTGIV